MLIYLRRAGENNSYECDCMFCVEKGEEDYGVFSYTIARIALNYVNKKASTAEFTVVSHDDEWNGEAKLFAYKLLLKKAFYELGLLEITGYVSFDDDAEIALLKRVGFEEEHGGKQGSQVKLTAKKAMKVFVTGAAGKLGYDMVRELTLRGHKVLGSDIFSDYDMEFKETGEKIPYTALDITDTNQVTKIILEFAPDAVIHCAAWTAVDDAEKEENRQKVYEINVKGTANIAKACKVCGAKMMYITTDYVFDGEGNAPWEADSKAFAPLNYYGKTKLDGESEVMGTLSKYFIVRTEWAFGKNGRNFVDVLLDLAKTRKQITVVDDQIGLPTYFYDLSKLLADMIVTEKYGFYNATNTGEYVSRYEYAKEIFRQAALLGHEEYSEKNLIVESVSSDEYIQSDTVRPLNSRLDNSKLERTGFMLLPDWKDALHRYLDNVSLS